jgi:type II secretory pathway component GspD/PulD (secretin)
MQRARWFVVLGSLTASLAILPLAGVSCPPAEVPPPEQAVAHAPAAVGRLEKTALNAPTIFMCEVKLADEGLNPATFKKLTGEEKLNYQLGRKVTLNLEQAKLQELCDELEKLLQINVILDKKALEEAAFDTATPIDKVFSQPTELRGALRLLLNDLGLSYIIEKETLLITTKTAQENKPIIKLYPVAEFVRPVGSTSSLDQDFDSLIVLIQNSVQPTTWKANGGQGDIPVLPTLDVLVISNTQEVHDSLEELFAELRKVHAAKNEMAKTNDTAVIRLVYSLKLPRAVQTKVTHDKDSKETVEEASEGEARFTMDELAALVKKTIEPATWNDERVSIAVLGESLVVTHTQATQRKLQEFLQELRVLGGPQKNANNPYGFGGGAAGCGEPGSARAGGLF